MTLRRRTPLKRTGTLKRSRLPRRNKARADKRRAEAFGRQAELCRRMPCVACFAESGHLAQWHEEMSNTVAGTPSLLSCLGLRDPQHCPTRGAGGLDKDTLPLCRKHHEEAGRIGEHSFNEKYGIVQRDVARAIHEELNRNGTSGT